MSELEDVVSHQTAIMRKLVEVFPGYLPGLQKLYQMRLDLGLGPDPRVFTKGYRDILLISGNGNNLGLFRRH